MRVRGTDDRWHELPDEDDGGVIVTLFWILFGTALAVLVWLS